MLIDLVITLVLLGIDQLTKYWAVHTLALAPGGVIPVVDGVFRFAYAENTGADVSFIRGRSTVMLVFRLLQVALAIYLLVRHRKKLAPITRFGLCLFLAGLIGNQINYLLFGYVPDMLHLPFLGGIIFNVADIWALAAMLILFVRLAFFEGPVFVDWLGGKLRKKPLPEHPKDGEPARENTDSGENNVPGN